MNYFIIKFVPLIIYFSIFSIVNSLVLDDEAFLAFVKGPANFDKFCAGKGVTNDQSKELLAQIYGTHLGILYYMRKNWHFANVRKEFEEFVNPGECQLFQNYLHIVYEFLFNVYAEQEDIRKPIFKQPIGIRISILVSLMSALELMAKFSKFCLYEMKLIERNDWPLAETIQLENEQETLDYYKEKFGQNSKTDESSARAKFDKLMEKMFKKLEEKTMERDKLEKSSEDFGQLAKGWPLSLRALTALASTSSAPAVDDAAQLYDSVLYLPNYGMGDAIDEALFVEFIKDRNNFVNFIESIFKETVEKTTKNFTDRFERHLGILYLMKTNWQCANAKIKIGNECEKLQRYLGIVYEYLFRVRFGISAVKPMFQGDETNPKPICPNLLTFIGLLNKISKLYFGTDLSGKKDEMAYEKQMSSEIKLTNENELKYDAIEKENSKMKFEEKVLQIASESVKSDGHQISASNFEGLLKQIFDKELEAMFEKWTKMALEEKAKVVALVEEEMKQLGAEIHFGEKLSAFYTNFSLLIESPFSQISDFP